jgi:GTPase
LHPGAVLCIAADDGENAPSAAGGTSSAQDILGSAGAGIDLAKAHLGLCLKLDKPLCIVVTKLDLASKSSLRQTLSKILSAVKAMGRTPSIIPPDHSKTIDSDLTTITAAEEDVIRGVVEKMGLSDGLTSIIPISMSILKFIFSLLETLASRETFKGFLLKIT